MLARKALAGTAAAPKVYVEDVFSTYLYTGNGSTQTITNNIDLSGEGGLVWVKSRGIEDHTLSDTARGVQNFLRSNTTGAQSNSASALTAFNTDGFSVGNGAYINANAVNYASWTFRKAEKFFDVVTWTGTGSPQNISHNLGSTPGCIMIKSTSISGNWWVWHRSLPDARYGLYLNGTGAQTTSDTTLDWTDPTSTNFRVGTSALTNSNGATYVAYLFAHDAGGFGDAGDQSVIKCGSFTGGSPATVDLGWEPQWVIIKSSTNADNWYIFDTMRGWTVDYSGLNYLKANTSDAEATGSTTGLRSNGFVFDYGSGQTFIYIAIRRGPMKTPEAGTEVYNAITRTGSGADVALTTVGFPVDWVISGDRTAGFTGYNAGRLTGKDRSLLTTDTGAESTATGRFTAFDSMNGFSLGSSSAVNNASRNYVYWNFKRAPEFFDAVNVPTNQQASAITSSHNLGVVPEMMIAKKRGPTGGAGDWMVYHKDLNGGTTPQNYRIRLNGTGAEGASSGIWNNTAPTSTQFTIGTDSDVNSGSAGDSTIVYLFGSAAGVSKVGSYTGTGTTLQVNCGFAAGARFVLIKRTDSTGDWYVWDTARGIVSGNDPYLLLNSTAAEVTNTDYIDTYSSGFEISSTAPAAINANGGTFIYLAIA